jgi:hypothetical protein
VLASEHWAAPVYLELLTTNAHTTRLEDVSELHGRSPNRVIEGRQRGIEDRGLDILAQSPTLTPTMLRDSHGVKNERLDEALVSLGLPGRLCRTPAGASPGTLTEGLGGLILQRFTLGSHTGPVADAKKFRLKHNSVRHPQVNRCRPKTSVIYRPLRSEVQKKLENLRRTWNDGGSNRSSSIQATEGFE